MALGPDISTTSNGHSQCTPLHAVSLPFIDDPETSPLPTSIDCFRLYDRTTKSIAARIRILISHDQGGTLDVRGFLAGGGARILLDVSGEPCRHPAANDATKQYVVSSVSQILFPSSLIGRFLSSMVGGRMRGGSIWMGVERQTRFHGNSCTSTEAPRLPNVGQNSKGPGGCPKKVRTPGSHERVMEHLYIICRESIFLLISSL